MLPSTKSALRRKLKQASEKEDFCIKLSQETEDKKQGYDATLFDRLISEQSVLRGSYAYLSKYVAL